MFSCQFWKRLMSTQFSVHTFKLECLNHHVPTARTETEWVWHSALQIEKRGFPVLPKTRSKFTASSSFQPDQTCTPSNRVPDPTQKKM
eukprot:790868-Amphidinium_carterae.2